MENEKYSLDYILMVESTVFIELVELSYFRTCNESCLSALLLTLPLLLNSDLKWVHFTNLLKVTLCIFGIREMNIANYYYKLQI